MEYYHLIMPECISDEAKSELAGELADLAKVADENTKKKITNLINFIDSLPTCGLATGRKRPATAYNIFMGKCMKQGKPMTACAKEYKSQKR